MMASTPPSDPVDLLIIGGGINGAGIARDAAGRGLRVVMCEKDDLAQGTSSRSGKYIHGGLRYLEYYEFRLVREALIEREILLDMAPHIISPLRLVLAHSPEQRPAWLIRLGLALYDHLGPRKRLPPTRSLDLRTAPEGKPLRPEFTRGFEYSDCWVDDSRLVLFNAMDAAERGATILTRTACITARREDGLWRAVLEDTATRETREVRARCIVNAAGPWVTKILNNVTGSNTKRRIRLVKGSHIILRKWWEGGHAYALQHADKRLIFVNPYMGDLSLIGTTDIPFEGDPEDVRIDRSEEDYLIAVLNRYFRTSFTTDDILHSYSGVRPLYDDEQANPSAVTRDYVLEVDGGEGRAPILSAFGGKITTYRKLSESAFDKLKPFFPEMGGPWTARSHLPGGDIPGGDLAAYAGTLRQRHAWLPEALAMHYAALYGTRALQVLDGARSLGDLGRHFGSLFYEAEARFLIAHEWARTAEDVLDRRTKHRLRLSPAEVEAFTQWMDEQRAPAAMAELTA